MYAMQTVCFISCLHLATQQHCTLPQKGGKWEGLLNIHKLQTHTLVEAIEELLRGVKGFGGWVFLLQNILSNIFHYFIIIQEYQIYFIKKNTYKKVESLKVRSTDEYLCQSCLINY